MASKKNKRKVDMSMFDANPVTIKHESYFARIHPNFKVLSSCQMKIVETLRQNDNSFVVVKTTDPIVVSLIAPFVLKLDRVLFVAPNLPVYRKLVESVMGTESDTNDAVLKKIGVCSQRSAR